MVENNTQQVIADIDFQKVLVVLWNGKWLITALTILSFLLSVIYILFIQTKNIQLDLKPITTFENEKYSELNAYDLYDVTRTDLLDVFIERLNISRIL